MKIVIVGDGKVGYTLTEQLSEEGHDIVVIDSNRTVLAALAETFDVMVVHGNGASLQTQLTADVGNSDLLIAATSADEINVLCCIIARKLGCEHTIARMRNPDQSGTGGRAGDFQAASVSDVSAPRFLCKGAC